MFTVVFYSCGGSESTDDTSFRNGCQIQCEIIAECSPEEWSESYKSKEDFLNTCTNSYELEMQEEIDEGDMNNSGECHDAFLKYSECLASLTCEKYEETMNCDEEESCQCKLQYNLFMKECSGPID